MSTTYQISSANDATYSQLDGLRYDSLDAAVAALRQIGGNDLVVDRADGGGYLAWGNQADMDSDEDGSSAVASITRTVRPAYYVDRDMCGEQPNGFDLVDFCERLQARCPDVRIVAITDSENGAVNDEPELVDEYDFQAAMDGE